MFQPLQLPHLLTLDLSNNPLGRPVQEAAHVEPHARGAFSTEKRVAAGGRILALPAPAAELPVRELRPVPTLSLMGVAHG